LSENAITYVAAGAFDNCVQLKNMFEILFIRSKLFDDFFFEFFFSYACLLFATDQVTSFRWLGNNKLQTLDVALFRNLRELGSLSVYLLYPFHALEPSQGSQSEHADGNPGGHLQLQSQAR
jgi:hypothetical protein